MNNYFLLSGILCFILGLVHSILGEILIFSSKRVKGKIVPTLKMPDLKVSHLRIIWATWHLASIFGWAIGIILIKIAFGQNDMDDKVVTFIINSSLFSMVAGAFLVLIGTNGKHPGWIVLLLISLLLIIGN